MGVGTVAEYLAAQPRAVRAVLTQIRRTIRAAVPEADEVISYQLPAYKLGGKVVIYFAGWKAHVALYPGNARTVAEFKRELEPYAVSKGTIRFPLEAPVPLRLIERLAKFRAREVAAALRRTPAR